MTTPELNDLPVWTDLADQPVHWEVTSRESVFQGRVLSMTREHVVTPAGEQMDREIVEHPGAVAVLALTGDDEAVVLRQYRHPIRHEMVEIPAGLLDVAGEEPWLAAQRELAEETQLAAGEWHILADLASSPGGNREVIRVFLATDLRPAPRPEGFVVAGEEAHMSVGRASLTNLRQAILAGHLSNPALAFGVLSWFAAGQDTSALRPPDAPWPMRRTILER